MKARLIAVSQPTPEVVAEGVENGMELITYCARVSNPANQTNMETADKLTEYLVKHKHWSPFEMVNAVVEVESTRDITRQLLRHRSFSFQEFSQRYAAITDLKPTLREARLQDTKNRQNSIETSNRVLQEAWDVMQERVWGVAIGAYEWALRQGIAKEVARSVLPEGMTGTRLYVNGTIRSWIHYLELRTANGTQKEHIDLARAIGQAVARAFPVVDAFITR